MVYAISDIHGHFKEFMKMIEKIHFSENDEMYVVGDAIDRGKDGMKVISYIMAHKNIHMIMGNHEHMFMHWFMKKAHPYYCEPYSDFEMQQIWFRNGGEKTIRQYTYKYTEEEKRAIRDFIRNLPYEYKINVDGKNFWLVHARPNNFPVYDEAFKKDPTYNCVYNMKVEDAQTSSIWNRIGIDGQNIPEVPDNTIVIVGHTPTPFYTGKLPEKVYKISDNIIDIDCGMVARNPEDRCLGCICLNTMEEFYVYTKEEKA